MKIITKIIVVIMLVLFLTSCARTEESYGLFNKEEVRQEGVKYCTIVGNVVWSIILFETIFMPIYFFGWSTMEPCEKQE